MEIVKKWYGTWIMKGEGLPAEAARVLIECLGGQINCTTYDKIVSGYFTTHPVKRFITDDGWYVDVEDIVAWMPLPKPIREDKLTEDEKRTLMRGEIESIERRVKNP